MDVNQFFYYPIYEVHAKLTDPMTTIIWIFPVRTVILIEPHVLLKQDRETLQ